MRLSRSLVGMVCLAVFLPLASRRRRRRTIPQGRHAPAQASAPFRMTQCFASRSPTIGSSTRRRTLVLPRNRGAFALTHRLQREPRRGQLRQPRRSPVRHRRRRRRRLRVPVRHPRATCRLPLTARRSIRRCQLHGKYDAIQQGGESCRSRCPALLSVEGNDNFREDYAPARRRGRRPHVRGVGGVLCVAGLGAQHRFGASTPETRDTGFVGLGTRLRIRPTVYLVGEVTPRVGGYESGRGRVRVRRSRSERAATCSS